jgi:hypothetical protein
MERRKSQYGGNGNCHLGAGCFGALKPCFNKLKGVVK